MTRQSHTCEACGVRLTHMADCPDEAAGLEFYCDSHVEGFLGDLESWSPDETGMAEDS